jgi:hypothetical protein
MAYFKEYEYADKPHAASTASLFKGQNKVKKPQKMVDAFNGVTSPKRRFTMHCDISVQFDTESKDYQDFPDILSQQIRGLSVNDSVKTIPTF